MAKSKRKRYHDILDEHIAELEAWISNNPEAQERLIVCIGPNRPVREYCGEYSDKWAIAGLLALDLGYARAQKMIDEYPEEAQDFLD